MYLGSTTCLNIILCRGTLLTECYLNPAADIDFVGVSIAESKMTVLILYCQREADAEISDRIDFSCVCSIY